MKGLVDNEKFTRPLILNILKIIRMALIISCYSLIIECSMGVGVIEIIYYYRRYPTEKTF